jgi:hypothetical protein
MRRTILRVYASGALLLLNTAVALLFFNVSLIGLFRLNDSLVRHRFATLPTHFNADGSPVETGKRTSYQLEWFDYAACQEAGERYASDVLDDFYELTAKGFAYEPWVQFSEPQFHGKRVSVELDGLGFPIRRTIHTSTRSDSRNTVEVFVFGGSTTFGYHVADEDTWPSHLARALDKEKTRPEISRRVRVTNYGRGYYNPSQELALFLDLLKTGHRPTLAVFMDGVNIGPPEDVPDFSNKVTAAVAAAQTRPSLWQALDSGFRTLPMARLGDAARWRLTRAGVIAPARPEPEDPRAWSDDYISMAAQRFAVARTLTRAVAREFGVEVRFFLQPIAMVNYPADLYRRPLSSRLLAGRDRARRIHDRLRAQDGVVDLGNLFEEWGIRRKAIVDYLHYSPAFNRFLGEEVARHIKSSIWRSGDGSATPWGPTGQSRHLLAGRS